MDFNRYISAAEFAPLAELFRREGESLSVPKRRLFFVPAGPQPPQRIGRGGRFPLCARHGSGRATCRRVRFRRGVRRRLYLDAQRRPRVGEYRSDVRQQSADADGRTARKILPDRRCTRAVGPHRRRAYAGRDLRTAAAIVRLDSAGALRIAAGALSPACSNWSRSGSWPRFSACVPKR